MAKIYCSQVLDTQARFYTLNRPTKGQKVLFLDGKTFDGILTVYEDTKDGNKAQYANGIKCIVASDTSLRAHIVPINDFTARSSVLVENSSTPQLKHKVTERIATLGVSALNQFGEGRHVASVGETYEVLVKSRNRKEPYTWTTLGLDESDETYRIEDGKIVFGDLSITIEECVKHFAEEVERQNKQLPKAQQSSAE